MQYLIIAVWYAVVIVAIGRPLYAGSAGLSCTVQGRVILGNKEGSSYTDSNSLTGTEVIIANNRHSFKVKTQADGKFCFMNLPVGSYILFVDSEHFGGFEAARTKRLTISENTRVSDIDISLHTAGAIAGRVLDQNEQPVRDAKVVAWKLVYERGQPVFRARGFARTGAQGIYHIGGLAEGSYYVAAIPATIGFQTGATSPAVPHPSTANALSFYPQESSIDSAQDISVGWGAQLVDVDLIFRRTRGFCATGIGGDEGSNPATVSLEVGMRSAQLQVVLATRQFRAGQRFKLCGLAPGSYVLEGATSDRQFIHQPVVIEDKDIDLGKLITSEGRSIEGTVVPQGGIAIESLKGTRVVMRPVKRPKYEVEQIEGSVDSEGHFSIPYLFPGEFLARVVRLPHSIYLKAVTLSGIDCLTRPCELGDGELDVTVGAGPASIGGVVKDDGGNVIVGATVLTAPLDSNTAISSSGMIVSQESDQYGEFGFTGLSPGKYAVFAFADAEDQAQNPYILDKYIDDAAVADLAGGQSAHLTVKIIDLK